MSSHFPIDYGQPFPGGADKLTRPNFSSPIATKCAVRFPRILRPGGTTPLAITGEDSPPCVSIMPVGSVDASAEHINCHKTLIKSATS
jgi:hypothetical protein